ncbi:60S ribosomal protein L36-2-like [Hibiscus syriacus]|uniref:60S ribosomal protein L36-2-like n=1 Tax=Hibiscus syriacus TaxID=106335 RepID=A0A6A3APW2_HIBSY|nr:zinc finger protein ZAT11-like [Hibiscus syriacus]KAE8706008.1 60S ribosomal protein L36-2-like [Hibiscus syriacus]
MKRGRVCVEIQGFDVAKCLMLLSQGLETEQKHHSASDVFECKTCQRCFPSFQALGGHRASHKRPKLVGDKPNKTTHFLSLSSTESKAHECSICGQVFSMGQALGGHMRRHRIAINECFLPFPLSSTVPVLKTSNSSRRVVCLDLNLTPLENDLQVLFGNKAPKVDICI